MHSFELHSNESACRKKVCLGLEQVIHTDLPGPFPTRYIRNTQYVFVLYAYQPNATLVRPMKCRSDEHMVVAYK